MTKRELHLGEGYGVEVEYAIVGRESLDILPAADLLLQETAGKWSPVAERGAMSWCNEFASHVIEIQTALPAESLVRLAPLYQKSVHDINGMLRRHDACLMPTSMHPWMNPRKEGGLWRRRGAGIYRTYDRLFDCRRHGWINIQSLQVNLSFWGDEEFGKLHDAVRLVLPLLPALAASSPVVEGRVTGWLDNRLRFYRSNQVIVPSITGGIIPERVPSRSAYEKRILERLYRDIAPLDPDGVLKHEWLNSRGAIARFDRSAIEVRLADLQECPPMDLAVCAAVDGAVRALVAGRWADPALYGKVRISSLRRLLGKTMRDGEKTLIDDPLYLSLFGAGRRKAGAGALWKRLLFDLRCDGYFPDSRLWKDIEFLLEKGTLARRIVAALGQRPSREQVRRVYRRLCSCLARGVPFAS